MSSNLGSSTVNEKKEHPVATDITEAGDERTDSASFKSSQGDEALKLVGAYRRANFSDEYNLRLRKKLVRLRHEKDEA